MGESGEKERNHRNTLNVWYIGSGCDDRDWGIYHRHLENDKG